jgi:hypothetical protein
MGSINHIYTTVSKGQIHIAADTQYVGSVDSYNNFLTQFFNWATGRSMTVQFDGKTYSVNKESYTRLIQGLMKTADITDVAKYSLFRPVAESVQLSNNNLKMRDVIAIEDRRALFRQLAYAIANNNTTAALAAIGEGAELDTSYYDREGMCPSFYNETAGLNSQSAYAFTVFHATPLLQAALKGNKIVCDFLQKAGANASITGKKYQFKREILGVDRSLEWVPAVRMVPHHHEKVHPCGHRSEHIEYKPEIHSELRDRVIVATQDSRGPEQHCQFSTFLQRLI